MSGPHLHTTSQRAKPLQERSETYPDLLQDTVVRVHRIIGAVLRALLFGVRLGLLCPPLRSISVVDIETYVVEDRYLH